MGQMTVVFSHTYCSEVERVDNLMLGMRKRVDLLVLDERRSTDNSIGSFTLNHIYSITIDLLNTRTLLNKSPLTD